MVITLPQAINTPSPFLRPQLPCHGTMFAQETCLTHNATPNSPTHGSLKRLGGKNTCIDHIILPGLLKGKALYLHTLFHGQSPWNA
eukprot:scaffold26009_cov19-Prasinocladus_malaysianus.AAC.1